MANDDDGTNITIRMDKDLKALLDRAWKRAVEATPKGQRAPSRADVYRTVLHLGLTDMKKKTGVKGPVS